MLAPWQHTQSDQRCTQVRVHMVPEMSHSAKCSLLVFRDLCSGHGGTHLQSQNEGGRPNSWAHKPVSLTELGSSEFSKIHFLKNYGGEGWSDGQWVVVSAAMPDKLDLSPRTHMERELTPSRCLLTFIREPWHMRVHTRTHIHTPHTHTHTYTRAHISLSWGDRRVF